MEKKVTSKNLKKDSKEETNEFFKEEYEEKNKVLKFIEADNKEISEFDSAQLKRNLLNLQKKISSNQEMRIKYPEQPEKFMESEIELHAEIQNLTVLGTAPDLYPDFIESKVFKPLVQLFSHENTDIVIALTSLFYELTDEDNLSEFPEEAELIIKSLIKEDFIVFLLQNLNRLDEKHKDDSDCVFNSLGIIENMASCESSLIDSVFDNPTLLKWLLTRIRVRTFDQNKLYSSEVLTVFLQNSENIRRHLGEINGIDSLLRSLAYYRNKNPTSNEEEELLDNLFDCLCASLLFPDNKKKFLEDEGIELMLIMLKEQKKSQVGAIKVLSYCFTGSNEVEMCQKFIDQFGLKTLFPKFMKPPKKFLKKSEINEYEEYISNVVLELMKTLYCHTSYLSRVLGKFLEDDMLKIERIVELHIKYYEKVENVRKKIKNEKNVLFQKKKITEEGISVTEHQNDNFLLEEMDAGLCALRYIDNIIGIILTCNVSEFLERLRKLFNQKNRNINEISQTLYDVLNILQENKDPLNSQKTETETEFLHLILSKLNRIGF